MTWLGRYHLWLGFIVFIIFLMTGQYMDKTHNHLSDMPDVSRALMRAQHLYILLAALIHMSLGSYFEQSTDKLIRILQIIGSSLITLATGLLIYSFFTELPSTLIERPLCRMGLYIILAGVLFHSVPRIFTQKKKNIEA